jgi:hypothetical protein
MQRDFVDAELAKVTALLAELGPEEVMARFGLEERLKELRQSLAELEQLPYDSTASAALYFGGRPVIGDRGIESHFGGEAVAKYQDLVAKILAAQESGGLGQRGVVPNRTAATLHITNVMRGSFGFLLEEVTPQQPMIETPLKEAVDQTTRLLDAFGENDEERFRTAVEAIDQRVLATAGEFFGHLRQASATLRLVTGEQEMSFDVAAVTRAAERATSTAVDDVPEDLRGYLTGVLPDGHLFEFNDNEKGLIRGKVDRALDAAELTNFNRSLVNVKAVARVNVRRIRRNDAVVRESFTLLGIEPAE